MTDDSGRALRITPVERLPDDIVTLLTPSKAVAARYGERSRKGPNISGIMAHNPELLKLFLPLSVHLAMNGLLPPRDREIAVLRIAWLSNLPFVWGEHVRLGKQEGITGAEIEQITAGSSARTWSDHDRAILMAVEQLHQRSRIDDDVWAILKRRWNDGQLIELPILIGSYVALGWFQAAVNFPLWEGNAGMATR